MNLYYYRSPYGNFGDDLNVWLWPKLISEYLDQDQKTIFVGIGTLLNDLVPVQPFKVVFGTGAGYGRGLPAIDDRWKIYCVRGPLTARALGLPPELAVTDAAALLRAVVPLGTAKKYPRAYMPHCDSARSGDWRGLCESVGIHYIDPMGSVPSIIEDIRSCELLITEAMHGAVVADALRVPWIAVWAYSHMLQTKWVDWCQSLQLECRPRRLPSLWSQRFDTGTLPLLKNSVRRALAAPLLRWTMQHGRPQMSSETAFNSAYERLLERLEQFKLDCRAGVFAERLISSQPEGSSEIR